MFLSKEAIFNVLFAYVVLCIFTYTPIPDIFYIFMNYAISKINFPAIIVFTGVLYAAWSQQDNTYSAEDDGYQPRYRRRRHQEIYETQMFQERNEDEERRAKIESMIPKLNCETIYKPSCWFTEEDKEDLALLEMVEKNYKTSLSEEAQKMCKVTMDDMQMELEELKVKKENIEMTMNEEEHKKYIWVWNEVDKIKEMRKSEKPFEDCNNNLIVMCY